MANITKLLETIKSAVYGKDMRSALHDSIKSVNDDLNTHTAKQASTSQEGHTTLSDSVSSSSSTVAATSKAVKIAYDTAVAAQTNIDSEETAREDADAVLQERINDEEAVRQTADNALQSKITAEETERLNADAALNTRITAVEETAHTHDNKEVLDGILQTDVDRWNTNSSESIEEQLTEQTASLMREIALLYGMLGVTVYDGGLFTQEYDADALDGGDFDTEPEDTFDCGTFEPLTATVSAGVDGGIY